jgi:hypothetical protein
MLDYKRIETTLEVNLKLMMLTNEDYAKVEHHMQGIPYKALVDSFMYAKVHTKMNVVFVVSIISQCIAKPSCMHYTTIKSIMIYLKESLNIKLCRQKYNITLH